MLAPSETSRTAERLSSITIRILNCARTRIDKFEIELLQILQEEFDLLACSFFSASPHTESLSLRGQVGFSYRDYQSFSLPRNSTAGLAFSSQEPILVLDLHGRDDYRDKSFINRYGLHAMLAVPIELQRIGSPRTVISSLCLYPKVLSDTDELFYLAKQLQPVIGMALQFSLDATQLLLRKQLVDKAIHVSDTASFFHRLLRVLKVEWNFEAGSVFLFDARANCLRLAGTTGMTSPGIEKRNIYYRTNEIEHQTVRCFIDQRQLVISRNDASEHMAKYRETLSTDYHSGLVTPFFGVDRTRVLDKSVPNKCLGVFRLVNRQIMHDGQVETAAFTWEDLEVVNFLADLIGVVTQMYLRVAQKAFDFERVFHGLETSILTITGALHNINDNVDCGGIFPPLLAHSIPNAISFTESIHEQIRVFKMRDISRLEAPKFSSVLLVADIISVLPRFSRNSARFYDVKNLTFDREAFYQDKHIARVPTVYSDQNLLLTVFKNLIENAIKYCRHDAPCFIKMDWSSDPEYVQVRVSDAGIGVPLDDAEFIFNETYQAENAIRRRTQGSGLGLFQCRTIMERLGGTISYKAEDGQVEGLVSTFVVRIPRREQKR